VHYDLGYQINYKLKNQRKEKQNQLMGTKINFIALHPAAFVMNLISLLTPQRYTTATKRKK